MVDDDPERTIINVKGVEVGQWNRARVCAQRSGLSMGSWLSSAIRQLADLEAAAPRELPPQGGKAGLADQAISINTPSPGMGAADLAGLLQAVANVTSATGIAPARADLRRAFALADTMIRQAGGLPPRPARLGKAAGQEVKKIGQSSRAPEPEVLPSPPPSSSSRKARRAK